MLLLQKAVAVVCFAGGIVSMLLAIYYYFSFLGGVKPEKKKYTPFLGPTMFFIPNLTDKEGNHAQRNFILSILAFMFFFGALYFMFPRQS